MKYIILKDEDGKEIPVVFPTRLVHSDVADSMRHLLMMDGGKTSEVVSAGFCDIDKIQCHGKSESLGGIESRETDRLSLVYSDSINGTPIDELPEHLTTVLRTKQ